MLAEAIDLTELKPIDLSDLKPVSSGAIDLSDLKPIDLSDLKPVQPGVVKAPFSYQIEAEEAPRPRPAQQGIVNIIPPQQSKAIEQKAFPPGTGGRRPGFVGALGETAAALSTPPEAITEAAGELANLLPGPFFALHREALRQAAGLASPTGIGTIFALGPALQVAAKIPGAAPALRTLFGAYFGTQAGKQFLEGAKERQEAWKNRDYTALADALAKETVAAATAGLGIKEAVTAVPHAAEAALERHNLTAEELLQQEANRPTPVPGATGTPLAGTNRPMEVQPTEISPGGTVSKARVVDPTTGDVLHEGNPVSVQDFISKNTAPTLPGAQAQLPAGKAPSPVPPEFEGLGLQPDQPTTPAEQPPATAAPGVANQAPSSPTGVPVQSAAAAPLLPESYELPTGTVAVTGRADGRTQWTKNGVEQKPLLDAQFARMVEGAAPAQPVSSNGQGEWVPESEAPSKPIDLSDLKPAAPAPAETAPASPSKEVIRPTEAVTGQAGATEDPYIRDENGLPLMKKGTEAPEEPNAPAPQPVHVDQGPGEVLPLPQGVGAGVPGPAGSEKPGVPVVQQADGDTAGTEKEEQPKVEAPKYNHSSTQVNLPEEFASKVRAAAAKIPDDILAEDGRENEPHITALYGLEDTDPAPVRKILEGAGPITAKVKTVSIFSASKDHPYDVVKVDVESPQLEELHKKLRELPHTNKFPVYRPHLTLAYVKAGEGKQFAGRVIPGLSGKTITFNELTFSPKEGEKTQIPLKEKPGPVTPDRRRIIMRGAHDRVTVEFPDRWDGPAFDAAAKSSLSRASGQNPRGQSFESLVMESKRLAGKEGIDENKARGIILDYHAYVKDLAKEQPPRSEEPLKIVPQSLVEFAKQEIGAKTSEKSVAGQTSPKDAFRMKAPELKALAEKGDKGAQAEIERRAAKGGAKAAPVETKAPPGGTVAPKTETKAAVAETPAQKAQDLKDQFAGAVQVDHLSDEDLQKISDIFAKPEGKKAPVSELKEHLAQTGFDKPYGELTDGQRESVDLRAARREALLPVPEKKPVTPQITPATPGPSKTSKPGLDEFMALYEEKLLEAVQKYPNEYKFPLSDVPAIAARMRNAVARGTFSNSGKAFTATTKELGIKNTYKAINEFVGVSRATPNQSPEKSANGQTEKADHLSSKILLNDRDRLEAIQRRVENALENTPENASVEFGALEKELKAATEHLEKLDDAGYSYKKGLADTIGESQEALDAFREFRKQSKAEQPKIESGEHNAINISELKPAEGQPVRSTSAEPLEEQLPEGGASPGEERAVTSGIRKSGTARKPRTGAGPSEGSELEPGGGTVSGVVGDPAEPERTFPPRAQDVVSTHHDRDYRIPDGRVVSGSPEARARVNIDAIKTLREIQQDNRPATVQEQDILAKYVGWGAVPQLFSGKNAEFQALQDELKNLLSDEEYADAQRSTTNAHYTGDLVVDSTWKAVQSIGAKPGMSWLEPAVGVGNFFGRQPQELLEGARRVGLDKDSLSAQIAKLLYPDSGIEGVAFEDAELPKDYFDGVISNVPFGNFGVHDAEFKGKKFITGSIHNYFFAKALTHVRPGGVVAFVTSRYTMDAYSPDAIQLRKYLSEQAHLIGAVRLPSGTFRQNSGTDVIIDVIFLRKRIPGEENALGHSWTKSETKEIAREGWGSYPISVNEYYHKNPENILGKESLSRGQFTNHDYDVSGTASAEQIAAAVENFPKIGFADWTPGKKSRTVAVRELNAPAEQSKLGGLFFDDKGNLFRKTSKGSAEPIDSTDGAKARIKGQLAIRDALVRLTDAELTGKPDMQLNHLRKLLNHAYDLYVKKNGPLSSQSNAAVMKGDPDAPLLVSLERRFEKGNKAQGKNPSAEKASIFERRMLKPPETPSSVGDPKEALYIALNEKGRLDFDRMSDLTGRTPEQLQQDLSGLIYEDPTTKTWQTAEEYLSGSVRAKLKQAKAIAKVEPKYKANVEALEKAQPIDVPPGEIRALLGVTWVPIDRYSEFAAEMLGADRPEQVKVKYAGGNWIVETGWGNRLNNSQKWSTARVGGAELLADSLNMRRTKVYDRSPDGDSINPQETQAARARQMEMQDHFEKWLFSDTKRGDELVRIYNDTQNDLRLRTYEGGHLTLPGMTKDAAVVRGGDLEPHQKAAVWRVIVQPNVLLAHAVGTGKTFEAIAGGMELQRLGLIRRPMYVVPNATLTSWQNQFAALYPQKRVLVFSEKDLERSKRQQLMAQIATGDWDAVVVPHSSFQFLPTGDAIFEEHYEKLSRELEQAIMEAQEAGLDTRQIKRMEKSKERLLTSLKDKRQAESKDLTVTWEQLGIDQLFVDESHEYKKLGFSTKQGNVAGIDQAGNQKTFDLLMKMRHTQKHGRGVVFMTGTPVTNTMGELFSIMKYLIEPELEARGIGKFDEWGANFGRTVDVFEPKIEGGGYQMKARFSKFVNLPELAQLFRSFADVVTSDMVDLPRPEIIGGKRLAVETQLTDEQNDVLEELRARAKSIRQDPRKALPDNMLSVYTDAQKMALDVRMVRPGAPDDPRGRLNEAAASIHKFWEESAKNKGSQLVFSDLGKPAEAGGSRDFSVYDELIRKLVERGIPRTEIAHIYQAKNKAQRSRLFQDVSDGKIRILIGSTMKMGVGVNVQQKLYALHHLDVPHRPSDLEQREGRILRQGNENPEVHLRYYVTKGSLDEAKFANVVRKAKFINQVMQGKSEVREAEDVGGMVPSLEMFQAMASGDPRVMRKMEVDAEVDRLGGVFSGWKNQQYKIRTELQAIPGRIQWAKRAIEVIQRDMAVRDKTGEKWVFGKQTLSGDKISKDVTAAIRKQLPKIIDGKQKDVEVGTAYGMPLLVSAEYGDKSTIKIEIGDTAYITPTPEEAMNGDLYRRIKNQIEDMEHAVSAKENVITQAQKEEKNLKNSVEENWPYAQQYQDMVAEQKQLIKDLGADKGDDAATAVGEGGEVVDNRVQAQESEDLEEEDGEDGPERDAQYMRGESPTATGPVRTAYRNGILWVNSAGMKKLAEVFGSDAANGMYIPSGKASGLLSRVAQELKNGISAALRAGPTITVVRMDAGESISKAKAKARHELFHATETWGGEGRAADLLEHPLAQRASALLAGGGYDASNRALMFSEIGAHLASGPAGWEAMGLTEDEASELFGTYLDLLDEETLFKLNRVAPQLKKELYAERAIRTEQADLGSDSDGQDDSAEKGQDEGTGGVQEGVPKDVQPGQGYGNTGEFKAGRLADRMTPGEGPEYEVMNRAEQLKAARKILDDDPQRAIDIAMLRRNPPDGMTPQSFLVVAADYARETKDPQLLLDLSVNSGQSERATKMGQEISMLAELDMDNPVVLIRQVAKAREEAASKRFGPKAKDMATKQIKAQVKRSHPDKNEWKSFIEALKCP